MLALPTGSEKTLVRPVAATVSISNEAGRPLPVASRFLIGPFGLNASVLTGLPQDVTVTGEPTSVRTPVGPTENSDTLPALELAHASQLPLGWNATSSGPFPPVLG